MIIWFIFSFVLDNLCSYWLKNHSIQWFLKERRYIYLSFKHGYIVLNANGIIMLYCI